MADTKNVYQRLLEVQKKARAPRQPGGRFGKARSAEQILAAYRPVCTENGLFLSTTDTMEEIGGRNYCTTTATVVNADQPEETVSVTASAWENEATGGLDTSQVTGKTSSYAKKYALQNLFAIDDTSDADFEHDDQPASRPAVSGSKVDPKKQKAAELASLMSKLDVKQEERADFFQAAIGKDAPTTVSDVEKSIQFATEQLGDQS